MASIDRSVRNMLDDARRGHVADDADIDQLPPALQAAVSAAIARIIAYVAGHERDTARREMDRSMEALRELADREGFTLSAPMPRSTSVAPTTLEPRALAAQIPYR